MTAARGIGWARGVGFVLGIGLAITAVFGWRLPRGDGRLGADVAIAFLRTGELEVSSTTPIITANGLQPGVSAVGTIDVRNSSGSKLAVDVAAEPSIHDLDALLWVDIVSNGTQIYRGPLGGLRNGADRPFTVSAQQTRTLDVRTWLPTAVDAGFEGRIDEVTLTFQPKVVSP